MNEKIRTMFKRAGGHTSIRNLMSNPMQQREYMELWDDRIVKFAELIVRECGIIAFEEWQHNGGASSGESAILKHFGIEK